MSKKTIKLKELSKDERSLLLYLETRVVDYCGKIDSAHMNSKDVKIAKAWSDIGFVQYGRIIHADISSLGCTTWCQLSPEAWRLAHQERRARAKRMWKNRTWKTTAEKQDE